MRYLFLAYLIINPLFYLVNVEIRQAQELCFQVSSILLIVASLFFDNREIRKEKFNVVLGVLCLWFIYLYCWFNTGWSILLNLFLGVTVYFTAIRTLKKEDFYLLLKGFCGVFIFSIIYQFGQAFGFDIRGQSVLEGRSGIHPGIVPDCAFFGLKASMGMYYAIVTALFLPTAWFMKDDYSPKRLSLKILTLIGIFAYLGLLFVPLASSYSTGAYMAGVVAMMFIFWFRKRILFWISLLPLIIGAVFFIVKMDSPMGMMTSRLPMWGMVIQDIHKSPVIGYGLDSFRQPETKMETNKQIVRYFKNSFNDNTVRVIKDIKVKDFEVMDWRMTGNISVDDSNKFRERIDNKKSPLDFWDNSHNIYLHIAYESGFIGLGLFFAIIYFMIKRFKRSKRGVVEVACLAAIISILVSGLTQFPFHLSRIAHTLPVLGALFYLSTEYDRPQVMV